MTERKRGMRQRLKRYAPPALSLLLLLLLWQGLGWLGLVELWLLPSPSQIVAAGVEAWQKLGLAGHTWQTLQEALLGFLLAVFAGLVLALLIDFSPLLQRAIYPLLVVSQTIPIIAIAPLLVLWLGYGIQPKIFVVALVCFFPIVVSTVDGLRAADPGWIDLLRSLGAKRWQIFVKVRFPAALPSFFSGLKVGITYSVIGAVIGEWVGGNRGLAFFMRRSHNALRFDREFAGIAVTSFLSVLLFLLVAGLERLLLPWYVKEQE
ncbi:MAG: ABC transporter permease [Chloroflexia bacterium]|nr:ABC transporter permease [Chloroflexia bacterium]